MRITKAELLEQRDHARGQRKEARDEADEARESAREEGNERYRIETALRALMCDLTAIACELSPMARLAVRALLARAQKESEL